MPSRSLDGLQPPSRLARTASRRRPYSLDLQATGEPTAMAFEAFKYVEGGVSLERAPALLGFLTSSTAS
jgi:hypothetical protein